MDEERERYVAADPWIGRTPEEWRAARASFIGQVCTVCGEVLTEPSRSPRFAVHEACWFK